jgi:hypothetical protein
MDVVVVDARVGVRAECVRPPAVLIRSKKVRDAVVPVTCRCFEERERPRRSVEQKGVIS